ADAFEGTKKERAVLPDRTAETATVVVALELGLARLEEPFGTQVLIAMELEHTPAQGIRAAFRDNADHRPRIPAVLRRRVVGDHLELLHRLDVRHQQHLAAPRPVVDARAV